MSPDGRRRNLTRSVASDTQPFASPDGKRVAFVSDRAGRYAVWVVGIDGRGLRRASADLSAGDDPPTLVGWSPDGRRLAVVSTTSPADPTDATSTLLVFEPGGSLRSIARFSGETAVILDPAWSPDGRFIAFQTAGGVRIAGLTGRSTHVLRGDSGFTWSAKGRLAMFDGRRVLVFDELGRPLARLVADDYAWSPEGDRLALLDGGVLKIRAGGGTGGVVRRIRVFSQARVRAARRNGGYSPGVDWASPDRVAIGANLGPAGGADVATGRLWRPNDWQFAAYSCCFSQANDALLPGVSADGSLLAGELRAGVGFALAVTGPDGRRPRKLVQIPGCEDDQALTPALDALQFAGKGHSLVYQSACGEPTADLYRMAPDGSGFRPLTRTIASEVSAAWSPDGRRIAYSRLPPVCSRGCNERIWIMDADGGHPHRLTRLPSGPDHPYLDVEPNWSPDGRSIVFDRSSANASSLVVIPAAGGRERRLGLQGSAPFWGRGRIVYAGVAGGLGAVGPDGRDRRRLVEPPFEAGLLAPAISRQGAIAYLRTGAPDRVAAALFERRNGHSRRIALPFAAVRDVAWSPDGRRLALVARTRSTRVFDVYTVRSDGTHPQRLTANLDALGVDWRR